MSQPREMMKVKISYLHIYSTFIKKHIYSKNLHNQEHYNIVITALASRGSSFEDFLAHLKTSQQIGSETTHFLPCINYLLPTGVEAWQNENKPPIAHHYVSVKCL